MNYKRLLSVALLFCLFLACGENDPPEPILTATGINISIDENPSLGQVLGTIQTETNQENLSFSLSNESAAGAMAIDASSGTVTVADISLFNFETSRQITATVNVSAGDLSASAGINITLNDVDEPFNLFDFEISIDENPSQAQVLGTMQSETNQEDFEFTLQTATPAGALVLDENTGELTVGNAELFDFEFFTQITATVEMTSGPLRTTANVVITINDVDEAFTVSDFNISVDENPQNGQLLGRVQTETSQGGLVFSLSNQSPENALSINANTGSIGVVDNLLFDFEANPQITATVTMSAGSASTTADVTISLNDVTETLTVPDFNISINENPQNDLSLGFIQAETAQGNINFSLSNQSPMGAMMINASNGELTVADRSLFDFETNPQITATVTVAGGALSVSANITIDLLDRDENFNIWSGPTITFTKGFGADPTQEIYQDRITDNVWITRGNSGREIYNAATESSATKGVSPAGTEWALGTTEDIKYLTFSPFRSAVGSPREVAGKDLVLHLIEDDVYLDVKFLSWSQQRTGSFSYERSTKD